MVGGKASDNTLQTNANGNDTTTSVGDEVGNFFGRMPPEPELPQQEEPPTQPVTTNGSTLDLEDPANYVIRPKRTGNHELIVARREPWTVCHGQGNPETFDIASSIGDDQDKASSVGDFEFLDIPPSQIPPDTILGHIIVEKTRG